jgi:hypothetical protein
MKVLIPIILILLLQFAPIVAFSYSGVLSQLQQTVTTVKSFQNDAQQALGGNLQSSKGPRNIIRF